MSAILDAFEIRWQPLLGCVGLGLLWCQDKDERKMVMGAGAVLVVALGRIATDGADWMSLTAVCSVAGYTLFERFTRLPGKLEPEGAWTAPPTADKPKERRRALARLVAGGQLYAGDPPKVVECDASDPSFEAVAAALPEDLRALAETSLLDFGPRLLCALASEFRVAFFLSVARYVAIPGKHPRLVVVAVATDGSGDDAPTFVVGLLAAGDRRWHYRCGPPRANRKETLDDADFATWWATEARALLLMA